jgi:undecaprenyl diphosphate synthase
LPPENCLTQVKYIYIIEYNLTRYSADYERLYENTKHIAFIMDGNGRWAKTRGLARSSGHKAGFDNIQHVLKVCYNKGIEIVSVFAWSTENWSRPSRE